MNAIPTWSIRLDRFAKSPVSPLALYTHVFGSTKIPTAQPGERLLALSTLGPHYVYDLPIPASAFTTDPRTPRLSSVLRLSRDTLPDLVASVKDARAAWYRSSGSSLFTSSYLDRNPLERVWSAKGATYAAILQLLGLPTVTKAQLSAAKERIVQAVADGTLPMSEELLDLERGFWADHMREMVKVWGGLDFDADLFPVDDTLTVQFPILRDLDAESGVLFHPTSVLSSPEPRLVAILTGTAVTDAPPSVPVYAFALTPSGEPRVLPQPSGGRRRRTRRRMLKNPKTLKKRIR